MIVIRPATLEDALWLSSRLRAEDVQEVETATGRSPQEIVPLSFQMSRSEDCYTIRRVLEDKVLPEPVAIFGACTDPANPDYGIVWLLGTRDVRLCALSLMRESALWLNHLSRRYPQGLRNYADSRNDLHIRWCQLTGFTLAEPIDIHGVPFHPIHRPQCVTQ